MKVTQRTNPRLSQENMEEHVRTSIGCLDEHEMDLPCANIAVLQGKQKRCAERIMVGLVDSGFRVSIRGGYNLEAGITRKLESEHLTPRRIARQLFLHVSTVRNEKLQKRRKR